MPYNEKLADRVREMFAGTRRVEEKKMMGGLTFMLNGKMCVGVLQDDLMVRLDPKAYEAVLDRPGCRPMDFTGRPMRGFVFVAPEGTKGKKGLQFWLDLAIAFNREAKTSKKKK